MTSRSCSGGIPGIIRSRGWQVKVGSTTTQADRSLVNNREYPRLEYAVRRSVGAQGTGSEGDSATIFSNAELVRAGQKLGPRVYSTGTILYGAETPFKAVIDNYEDALATPLRQKAMGAFSVKSYNQQRRDVRQMIIKAARELQMEVVPEGGSLLYMNESMVLDGHTTVEHSLPVPKLYKDVVSLFAKSKTGYTPTLIVGYGGLSGELYWYQNTNVWENQRLLTFAPREIVDARSRRRIMAAERDRQPSASAAAAVVGEVELAFRLRPGFGGPP